MRQLNPLSNIVLACLAAVGLVASLSLPWYAPAVIHGKTDLGAVAEGEADGPMQHFSDWVQRVFSTGGRTVSGADALGNQKMIILGIAVVVAVMCLVMLLPAMRPLLRDIVRVVGLLAPAAVLWLGFVDKPGNVQLEIRWGLIVSALVAFFMASCAWHVGSVRKQKVAAVRPSTRFSN